MAIKDLEGREIGLSLASRFFKRFIPVTESGCWIWESYSHQAGYGLIKYHGTMIRAHRLSYLIHIGAIPENMLICHSCDIPACVNPAHLFLGRPAENTADMFKKDRFPIRKGADHHGAKLTDEKVIAIRKDSRPQKEIAADYGVIKQTISDIKLRKIWRHI